MKRLLIGGIALAALALVAGGLVLTAGAETKASASSKTVQGEVLDLTCYMAQGAHGAAHKDCADMCIKGGGPIGLLSSSGEAYVLVEDHSAKAPYDSLKNMAAEQVKVTGEVTDRGGLRGIVVKSVEKA